MDPFTIGILGISVLILMFIIGVPIGITLGVVGFLGTTLILGFKAAVHLTVNGIYYKIASYTLVTVPLFILMGLLAASGGLTKTLYNNLSIWMGKFKSGLGVATVIACAAFGTVTGSSIVTASVFAKVSAPEMRHHGYDKKLAYGICASAGAIGMLIPPSLLAIMYGVMSGVSVGKLLIAGVGPGLLLTILFTGGIVLISRLKPHLITSSREVHNVSWRDRLATIPSFWPIIVAALIVFGGIFGGIFNPTEAGAVTTFVILLLLFFMQRKKSLKMLISNLKDTAMISSMVFLILGGACIFSRFLVVAGISDTVIELILGLHISNLWLVSILTGTYLVMGMFIDSISMLCITIPILAPIIEQLGVDPIYFAMLVITATQVGIITPPLGLAVYTTKSVAEPDVSLGEIFAGVIPFFWIMLLAMIVLILFPGISTFLPSLMLD